MITVDFISEGSHLNGFEIKGHSGYSEEGTDIICSAVSSAALMSANTVTEIFGCKAEAETEDGFLKFILSEYDENAVKVLEGLRLHLEEVSKQYPEYITINNGGTKNA